MEYTNEEKIEIANTIIRQMGGSGKLRAMVGMSDALALGAGVQFSFKGSRTMNKVKIELTPDDLYNISFYHIPKLNRKNLDAYFKKLETCNTPVKAVDGVYNDQLIDIFESTTGLYLHF